MTPKRSAVMKVFIAGVKEGIMIVNLGRRPVICLYDAWTEANRRFVTL